MERSAFVSTRLWQDNVFEIGATDNDLDWIFVAGSAMLSISIALNALSLHGACTAVFVAVAAIGGL